jgi:AcrR family transcriptional regulator
MLTSGIEREIKGELGALPKRERTRRQIIAAAMDVLGSRGIAATEVKEIAARAGVTAGTFYNHFKDKDEVIGAVSVLIIRMLEVRAGESRKGLPLGAEKVANGCHRYLAIARKDPSSAQLILELAAGSPDLLQTVGAAVLADIRLGVRQKDFHIFSEKSAVDLVHGLIMLGMRYIALGAMPAGYEKAVVATVLQGLGLPAKRALELSRAQALATRD